MHDKKYWAEFWNNDQIINNKDPQLQVGRSIAGVPISDEQWLDVLNDVSKKLCLNSDDVLLDIGSGSGLISMPFAKIIKSVTAVDISEKLLQKYDKKINTICSDIFDVEFDKQQFSKIVIYFAIQHFSKQEVVILLRKAKEWLTPQGILLIGDIPDEQKIFDFYNTRERERALFHAIESNSPIIGTWFSKFFFMKLGGVLEFSDVTIREQPKEFINHHYRFDVIFKK
jgi:cyclopropane fatty-acyl-phospholipid synthase-like methyltransferase